MHKALHLFSALLFCACVPVTSQYNGQATTNGIAKTLQFDDLEYEPNIKTVQLYKPMGGRRQENNFRAATSISDQNLVLEFDDLSQNAENYMAKNHSL